MRGGVDRASLTDIGVDGCSGAEAVASGFAYRESCEGAAEGAGDLDGGEADVEGGLRCLDFQDST